MLDWYHKHEQKKNKARKENEMKMKKRKGWQKNTHESLQIILPVQFVQVRLFFG